MALLAFFSAGTHFVGGGRNQFVKGASCTVGGGIKNTYDGDYGTIVGGSYITVHVRPTTGGGFFADPLGQGIHEHMV